MLKSARSRMLLLPLLAAALVVGLAAPASARSRGRSAYYGGVRIPAGAITVIRQGRCDWLAPHLAAAGLPVATFEAIAARESGCAVNGVHVVRRTDLSTSRFGLNFRGRMPRYWARLCGVSNWTVPGASVSADVKCAAAAYRAMGLRPWRA